jgi:hypothetical protein
MEGLNKSCANTPGGGCSWLNPNWGEGIGCLIVSPEDMVQLKDVKFLLQLSYLLPVCSHAGVMTVRLSLIDNELRVFTNVKPLNPKFGGDA